MTKTTARAAEVTPPAAEPLSLAEVRAHVELAATDTNHDTELERAIEDARQQWERDTGEHFIQRSMRLTLDCLEEMRFPHRPVTAIGSIKYYDTGNTQQTLSTSVYQLDTANNRLRLAYDQSWPAYAGRWDAIEINYTLGSHSSDSDVPAIAKRAMLLLVGYYFRANKGDDDRAYDLQAYERLVAKHMRSTYP